MALGFIGDMLGLNAGDPAKQAAAEGQKALTQLNADGSAIIDDGTTAANGFLRDAKGLYGNLTARGDRAGTLYDNALGLNGADGNAAATSAFTSSPGYQFQLDQGLQALDRGASARGSFQSGGAGIDEMKYATGLAGQDFNSWLDRLNGVSGLSTTGTAGQAGALGDLASLYTGASGQKLDLLKDVVSGSLGASNQNAEGESANKAGLSNLFGNVAGMVGKKTGWF